MGHYEAYLDPQLKENWQLTKTIQQDVRRKVQHSSWTVLALAGLLSGGCYDASTVSNSLNNGDFEHAAVHLVYPLSEFALAAGITKILSLTGREKEEIELQPDHTIFLPDK